jgi:hypothetical protein
LKKSHGNEKDMDDNQIVNRARTALLILEKRLGNASGLQIAKYLEKYIKIFIYL